MLLERREDIYGDMRREGLIRVNLLVWQRFGPIKNSHMLLQRGI